MSKIKKIFLAGNILLAGVTILAYFSRIVEPMSIGWISMLGLTYSAFLIAHLFLFIGWLLFGDKKYALISLVFLCLEIGYFNNWFQISFADKASSGTTLTIGSLNLQFAKALATQSPSTHHRYKELTSQLEKLDILCVQEHGSFNEKYINFPYQHLISDFHVGIYSNHPIIDQGTVSSSFNSANNCIWADILYQEDTIRVYSAHLESNRHDGMIPTFVDQVKEESKTTSVYAGILKHYVKFSTMRREQAIDIRTHQRSSRHPAIITGDFNDVPLSAMYQSISKGLKDTFVSKGMGSGSTMSGKIPGLRIDYILTTPDWQILDHNIEKDTYSDHYLLTAQLEL